MSAANCCSLEVLCGGGCLLRDGGSFEDVTHPHIVIFSTRDILKGEELCINYGDDYCESMGLKPAASATPSQAELIQAALDAPPATQQAILEALLRSCELASALPLAPAEAASALRTSLEEALDAASDPSDAFAEQMRLIQTLSGRDMHISTGCTVTCSGGGFGFSLRKPVKPAVLFEKGMAGDTAVAASFLEQSHRTAFRVSAAAAAPAAPVPPPPRRKPPLPSGLAATSR
jgi:hypothetical protein